VPVGGTGRRCSYRLEGAARTRGLPTEVGGIVETDTSRASVRRRCSSISTVPGSSCVRFHRWLHPKTGMLPRRRTCSAPAARTAVWSS